MLSSFEGIILHCSSVAQWWSNRLLTGRLAVRVRPEEPYITNRPSVPGWQGVVLFVVIIERCPSGRRSTIGNRVYVMSVSRVRIPSSLPSYLNMESYPRGRRGRFAKPLGWATAARVRIPHSPPFAPVAQSVERIHGKDEVAGSIPVGSTSSKFFNMAV